MTKAKRQKKQLDIALKVSPEIGDFMNSATSKAHWLDLTTLR